MAARKNGITVPARPKPALIRFTVTGVGPTGETVTFTQDGTDMLDALWEARKRCLLSDMRAVEKKET